MSEDYCSGPECDRPVYRLGLCVAHAKQQQRHGHLEVITEKLNPEERLLDAMSEHQVADTVEDYERTRRAVLLASKTLGKKEAQAALIAGLRAARERGVRLGRPPKVAQAAILEHFKKLSKDKTLNLGHRSKAIAAFLGVSERTVRRALSGIGKNLGLWPTRRTPPSRPRPTGPRVQRGSL